MEGRHGMKKKLKQAAMPIYMEVGGYSIRGVTGEPPLLLNSLARLGVSSK